MERVWTTCSENSGLSDHSWSTTLALTTICSQCSRWMGLKTEKRDGNMGGESPSKSGKEVRWVRIERREEATPVVGEEVCVGSNGVRKAERVSWGKKNGCFLP